MLLFVIIINIIFIYTCDCQQWPMRRAEIINNLQWKYLHPPNAVVDYGGWNHMDYPNKPIYNNPNPFIENFSLRNNEPHYNPPQTTPEPMTETMFFRAKKTPAPPKKLTKPPPPKKVLAKTTKKVTKKAAPKAAPKPKPTPPKPKPKPIQKTTKKPTPKPTPKKVTTTTTTTTQPTTADWESPMGIDDFVPQNDFGALNDFVPPNIVPIPKGPKKMKMKLEEPGKQPITVDELEQAFHDLGEKLLIKKASGVGEARAPGNAQNDNTGGGDCNDESILAEALSPVRREDLDAMMGSLRFDTGVLRSDTAQEKPPMLSGLGIDNTVQELPMQDGQGQDCVDCDKNKPQSDIPIEIYNGRRSGNSNINFKNEGESKLDTILKLLRQGPNAKGQPRIAIEPMKNIWKNK